MSLSTFLACFIAIATAFVLVEGGGWQKKKSKRERERETERETERERETLACSSLLARFYRSSSLPSRDPGAFKQSRSPKRKNELLLSVFLHTPHLRSSPASCRQREPPLCAQHLLDCPPPDPTTLEREDHGGCEIPLKGHV